MDLKTKINIYLLLFILLTFVFSLLIYLFAKNYNEQQLRQIFFEYKGYFIQFRRPIKNSFLVKIYPNEDLLKKSTYLLATGIYKNLTIVIFEFDNNEATAIETAEIISKIKNLLEYEIFDYEMKVNVLKIKKDLDEINISDNEYYIFLKSYLISNETYIKIHKLNFVEITGKNLEEFDLATIRFLISFLENMKEIYK